MRVVGDLANADFITENTFWIGVYPGLTEEMISYMLQEIQGFISEKVKQGGVK
jgi:CDP-6-deoxy-D-xylo-4-hexulose-3-dehydrase